MVIVDRGNKEYENISYLMMMMMMMMFQYLAFPCGLIRGALANLGVVCIVTAEVTMMPACELSLLLLIACILTGFCQLLHYFYSENPSIKMITFSQAKEIWVAIH